MIAIDTDNRAFLGVVAARRPRAKSLPVQVVLIKGKRRDF
jgi:hypothetical protein